MIMPSKYPFRKKTNSSEKHETIKYNQNERRYFWNRTNANKSISSIFSDILLRKIYYA